MHEESVCWGVLGAADIVRKNWQAIRNSRNGWLKAIASRSKQRSANFIEQCQRLVPFEKPVEAVEGYESLLNDPQIDAVYIPLPTGVRDQWALSAIEAGKHVLIEKPCSQSAEGLRKIVAAASAKNLQVIDGVMFAHSDRFQGLLNYIHQQNVIGKVRRISSQFSFCADSSWAKSNIRGNANLEPFGALGDLGWYCIRLALEIMQKQLPIEVIGRTITPYSQNKDDIAVPFEFEAKLIFADAVHTEFYCSFVTAIQQLFTISGTNGYISMEDFVLPFSERQPQFEIVNSEFDTETCDFKMRRNGKTVAFDEASNSSDDSQEARLFRNFNQCVLSGNIVEDWPEISLKTQLVMDALMKSANEESTPVKIEAI